MSQNNIESKLPMGVSDFNELITQDYLFVDKTNFIREVIQDGAKVVLLTRPRRFGKTLTLSMLYYFLQCQQPLGRNIFTDLAISQDKRFCEQHQNKYPVIFVSFKDVKKASYEQAYAAIVALMSDLYSQHRYLLDGLHENEKVHFNSVLNQNAAQNTVENAIKKLNLYLKEKFNQHPIILIDEYDTPIQHAYSRGYYDSMIDLMRNIFGCSLKEDINSNITKVIVTGITRIAQESLFSGVNNFEVYSVLREEYGQYFGFTETEVEQLITQSNSKVDLQSIQEWYNGYRVEHHTLYNPWSILSCLKNKGKLKPYWLNTSDNILLRKWIEKANGSIRDQFEQLLQGSTIDKPLMENLFFQN